MGVCASYSKDRSSRRKQPRRRALAQLVLQDRKYLDLQEAEHRPVQKLGCKRNLRIAMLKHLQKASFEKPPLGAMGAMGAPLSLV